LKAGDFSGFGLAAKRGLVQRQRQQTPNRSIFIKAPQSVLDRFIQYTNELGVDAYWQAVEKSAISYAP
jgi:hypothetical protein